MPQPTLALTPQDTESKIPLVASPLRMVKDFHDKFDGDIDVPFAFKAVNLRYQLIHEEFMEVEDEFFKNYIPWENSNDPTAEIYDIDKKIFYQSSS